MYSVNHSSINCELTIGLPVFNREKYVGQAIESILNQNFRDFVLIISDNASTDQTADICKKWAELDSRVVYIQQPENIGMVGNFLFLLDKCVSKYFMWAASDDLWSQNWIEDLMPMAKENSVIPLGRTEYINSIGGYTTGIMRAHDFSSKFRFMRRLKYVWNLNPLPQYGIFKSAYLKSIDWTQILGMYKNGKLFFRNAGDFYFCYECLKYNRFVLNPHCVRYGRVHDANSIDYDKIKINTTPFTIFKNLFFTINIISLLKMSNFIESIFLIPIYILIIFRNIINFVVFLLNKFIGLKLKVV